MSPGSSRHHPPPPHRRWDTPPEAPLFPRRVPSVEAYEAAMVLSGVGDALGYRGGRWEYCTSGAQIHAELAELGGLEAITLQPPEWPVSDDTVLHLATAEALATGRGGVGGGSPSYSRPRVECTGGGGEVPFIPLGCREGFLGSVVGPHYTSELLGGGGGDGEGRS